jgi:RHS repeat-associated protein
MRFLGLILSFFLFNRKTQGYFFQLKRKFVNSIEKKNFCEQRKKTNLDLCKIMGCKKLTYQPQETTLKVAHSIFNNVKKTSAEEYLFGYQGSEKDNEVNSSNGSSYTTEFRQLDTRLGRWFSSDPVFQPWQSSYTSMDNNPVNLTDVLGDETGKGINFDGKVAGDLVTDEDGNKFVYWGTDNNGKPILQISVPVELDEVVINATKKEPDQIFIEQTFELELIDERSGWTKFWDWVSRNEDKLKGRRAVWKFGVVMYNSKNEQIGEVSDLPVVKGSTLDIKEADQLLDYILATKSGYEGFEKLSEFKKLGKAKLKTKESWQDYQKRTVGKFDPKNGHVTSQKSKGYQAQNKAINDFNAKAALHNAAVNKQIKDLVLAQAKEILNGYVGPESLILNLKDVETPISDIIDRLKLAKIDFIVDLDLSFKKGLVQYGNGYTYSRGYYDTLGIEINLIKIPVQDIKIIINR